MSSKRTTQQDVNRELAGFIRTLGAKKILEGWETGDEAESIETSLYETHRANGHHAIGEKGGSWYGEKYGPKSQSLKELQNGLATASAIIRNLQKRGFLETPKN